MSWTKEEKQERNTIRRWGWWLFGSALLILAVFWLISKGFGFGNKLLDPDRAVSTYENFYQLYEQADQICNDISVNELADSISGGFSRNERRIALENKLNDVIRDYNAQSEAWTKSMWKSEDLPYKLKRADFNCKQ